jgi:O-antigen ligase
MYQNQFLQNAIFVFRSLSGSGKVAYGFWLLGPFILLIERTPADFWLTSICLIFICRAFVLDDFHWLKETWVRHSFFFLAICLTSAIYSDDVPYSLGETIAWFRFPVFAMAVVFWLGKNEHLLYGMLFSIGMAMVIMSSILFLEYFLIGQIGGRLSWPYGDLVPGNYLAKASMPVFVILAALISSSNTRSRICWLPIIYFTLAASVLSGERINFLIRCFAGVLAMVTYKLNKKNIFIVACLSLLSVLLMIWLDKSFVPNFVVRFVDQMPISSDSPYYRAAGPGIIAFLDNPFLGIGPGNLRNLCNVIIDGSQNFDCHPHPHNFYVQILGETGLLGIFAACLFIFSILATCWKSAREWQDNVLINTAWITPFVFFWPIASTPDFFGQWNNIFMWSAISISLALARLKNTGNNAVSLERLNYRSGVMETTPFIKGFLPKAVLVFFLIILVYLFVSPYQNCKRDYATRFENKIKECVVLTPF